MLFDEMYLIVCYIFYKILCPNFMHYVSRLDQWIHRQLRSELVNIPSPKTCTCLVKCFL